MIYKLKDTVTTQVYSNLKISDIAQMLKIKEYSVYRAMDNDRLIHKRFKVIRCGSEETVNSNLPKDLLIEWDKFTRKFRKHYGQMEVSE